MKRELLKKGNTKLKSLESMTNFNDFIKTLIFFIIIYFIKMLKKNFEIN